MVEEIKDEHKSNQSNQSSQSSQSSQLTARNAQTCLKASSERQEGQEGDEEDETYTDHHAYEIARVSGWWPVGENWAHIAPYQVRQMRKVNNAQEDRFQVEWSDPTDPSASLIASSTRIHRLCLYRTRSQIHMGA
jgi:hypothetical protein